MELRPIVDGTIYLEPSTSNFKHLYFVSFTMEQVQKHTMERLI